MKSRDNSGFVQPRFRGESVNDAKDSFLRELQQRAKTAIAYIGNTTAQNRTKRGNEMITYFDPDSGNQFTSKWA